MHHALYIEEILLNIFHHCHTPRRRRKWHSRYANVDLAILARTCKAFKGPALDMIWAELNDLSPLMRCLPSESSRVERGSLEPTIGSLRKPLEQTEWDIILRYARRVRVLPHLHRNLGLAEDYIKALSDPPASVESIFPNLRIVGLRDPLAIVVPLVRHFMIPTVTTVSFESTAILGSAMDGFARGCPYVTNFSVSQWARRDTISALICSWESLCSVRCASVDLTIDALSHLSRLRNLFRVSFVVHDAIVGEIQATQSSPFSLTFPALLYVHLNSSALAPVKGLFRYFRAPVLRALSVALGICPSAPDLGSFFMGLHEVSTHVSLNDIHFRVRYDLDEPISPMENPLYVTFANLHPLTVFVNIKSIVLDIPCIVNLSESELLTLASSWPCLEKLRLGEHCDWTPSSGITPDGLLRLLERCRSLRELYFVFDTREYTEIPRGDPWRGIRMQKGAFIHVLASPIEPESIDALAVFFHAAPFPDFGLITRWDGLHVDRNLSEELCELYRCRWAQVRSQARDLWRKRTALGLSLKARFSQHPLEWLGIASGDSVVDEMVALSVLNVFLPRDIHDL